MKRWMVLVVVSGCFYVTPDEHSARWDIDQDGVERPDDCEDKDKDVQDLTWYSDFDGDGFGDPDSGVSSCEQPTNTVDNGDDCDDEVETTNPGASELCNNVDDDCDTEIDEDDDLVPTWFEDTDGDGYGDEGSPQSSCTQPTGYVDRAGDCNDDFDNGGFDVNPDAVDVCDGIDNDCDDPTNPDNDPVVWVNWYADADGDGFGAEESPTVTACFGDPGDITHDTTDPNNPEPGFDCDDVDFYVNPGVDEVCDGIDNDCDGNTDDATAVDADDWWLDADEDGFGLPGDVVTRCTCDGPANGCPRVTNAQDCDDTDPDVNPWQLEICANLIDDDCDGVVDGVGCINCDTSDTGC